MFSDKVKIVHFSRDLTDRRQVKLPSYPIEHQFNSNDSFASISFKSQKQINQMLVSQLINKKLDACILIWNVWCAVLLQYACINILSGK